MSLSLKTQNLDYLYFRKSVSHRGSADRVPACLIMTSVSRAFWQLGLLDLTISFTKRLYRIELCLGQRSWTRDVCALSTAACNSSEVHTHNQWETWKFQVLSNCCWFDSFWRDGKLTFSVLCSLAFLLGTRLWIFYLDCDAALHTSVNFSPVSNACQTMLDQTPKQGVFACGGILIPGWA